MLRDRAQPDPAADQLLGRFPDGTASDVVLIARCARHEHRVRAVASHTPQTPVACCAPSPRGSRRVYEKIGAALALEVGKNRMEALGESAGDASTASRTTARRLRSATRLRPRAAADDPLAGYASAQPQSVMKPYGAWVVIAPFNFPLALARRARGRRARDRQPPVVLEARPTRRGRDACSRICATLAPGPAFSTTRMRHAAGRRRRNAHGRTPLRASPSPARTTSACASIAKLALDDAPRPCITEMGGKNAVIVTAGADLERAALGIVRSAYGMCGQKCSALSRIYVRRGSRRRHSSARPARQHRAIRIGDPTRREHWLGPVANASGCKLRALQRRARAATVRAIIAGGRRLTEGPRCAMVTTARRRSLKRRRRIRSGARRCSCRSRCCARARTSTTRAPRQRLAARPDRGLLRQRRGSARWFFDHIEAGVT